MSRMGPGAEFDRIRAIATELGPRAAELGDDCAMVPLNGGFLALSTDTSVEGVHFRRDWISLEEIGWRATAGALSDLAAVGADPVGVLVAVTVPAGFADTDLVAIMSGAGDAVTSIGGQVLGGDLSRGETLQVAVTVVGSTATWLGRSGAQSGDSLWVTGALGGARAALLAWRDGREPSAAAREAFAHPQPRITAGRVLVRAGAHAALDLSDGLAGDARHLASASGVTVTIDLHTLPVHPGVARDDARDAAIMAGEGGEDYELLVAMPPAFGADDARRVAAEMAVPLTRVGSVSEGSGVRLLWQGKDVALRGFDHFQ